MLNLSILDEKRQRLLPIIAHAGEEFYLAGGTALALLLGHRDSIDFDFFIKKDIDTSALFAEITHLFDGYTISKTQEEKNTLSCIVDSDIRLSFFGYHYPLLEPTINEYNLNLASLRDIGCMKLSAITSRVTLKDYVDLYYIFQHHSLEALLGSCSIKYPTLDHGLILKSLVYFEDVTPEPVQFLPGFEVSLDTIKNTMDATVQNYWDTI